ncbi:hypothetical protein ACTOB_003674 [Actinoplanes oblitus]|uniref:DUF3800 domain-containing protein n=1 Tax=Actinoplanes oblitus TaxID=3040509 RepID=A0ABY8WQ67_9ACTN|nr:hypothetical protein [Actinoplanes oblitus]WIN00001.1 hypothetical protein ACTOB_003674 [Actinoplanes oblitus]
MSNYPVAFADEAFLTGRGHPGVYVFTGVVVDSDDLVTVMNAARFAAGQHQPFHASALYHRGHITPIEDMLDTVRAHAGWTFIVAQAPITGTQEAARQAALTQLLKQLDGQKVSDVVLDTRASQREQVQTQLLGEKVAGSDTPDMTTYSRLVRTQQISSRMRLMHADDRRQPGLWMADVAAWAFQRGLGYDEQQWISRITDISTVIDAQTGHKLSLEHDRAALPNGERGPGHLSPNAQASLSSQRFYTLNGGTTNLSRGPGYFFDNLLQQVEAASQALARQQIARQATELNRTVQGLTARIQQSAQQPMSAVRALGQQPQLDQSEPEIAAPLPSELTID